MKYSNSNKVLLKSLNMKVSGHERAKKVLISALARQELRHYQKYMLNIADEDLLETSKIMLIGGSGTGKTYIVECLAEMLDFPLVRLDATMLNPTGAAGGIKPEDVYKKLLKKADDYCKDPSKHAYSIEGTMDRMVVFVDEVDKLCKDIGSTSNWTQHVQESFLTIFEDRARMSGVTWIFAGAFVGLDQQSTHANPLGFTNVAPEANMEDLDEAIVKYGMVPELAGRMTAIVKLDKLTEMDYIKIIRENILPKVEHDLWVYNAVHTFSDSYIEELAKKCVKSGQGVRYAKRKIAEEVVDLEFNYEERDAKIGNEYMRIAHDSYMNEIEQQLWEDEEFNL